MQFFIHSFTGNNLRGDSLLFTSKIHSNALTMLTRYIIPNIERAKGYAP